MSAPSVQPDHRAALWKTLLTAEMNVCYWTWISDRYARWDTILKVVVVLATSAAVASWNIWEQYPQAWKGLSALATVAAVVHPIVLSSHKLNRISGLVGTWKEVFYSYELLWERDECLASAESWSQFEQTKRRESSIDETNLPKSKRLIRKTYQHVKSKRGSQNG